MDFIKYPVTLDENIVSSEILRIRREQLGFSQQQVADGAKIQLRQYQRLETGERSIENATLKTALCICAVLKLNPYTFFPEAEGMNKYREQTPRNEDDAITKEEAIPMMLQKACELMNAECGTNYSLDNIKVAYCTMTDVLEVYKDFTTQYGFHSESRTIDDYETVFAEAFVGPTDIDDPGHVDGILIRKDAPAMLDNPEYYMMILVHELSHIFCTTHETDSAGKAGQRFYDLYCMDTPGTPAEYYNNGYMCAGYAIWREFIADIIQDIVYQQPSKHLDDIAPILRLWANDVKVGNAAAKLSFQRYLSEIMNSWEGGEAETFDELEPVLKTLKLPFIRIIKFVFDNLHGKDCHKITPEFIEKLGGMYLADMIQNTPPNELMKLARTYGYDPM